MATGPQVVNPISQDLRIRYGRVAGLSLTVAGFIVMIVGWNGAASVACVDCQIPYLISGGLTGLGLVVVGTGLLIAAAIRTERMELGRQLDEAAAARMQPRLEATTVHVPVQVMPMSTVTASGSEYAANGQVVAGRSTYHLQSCRLVRGKGDLQITTVDAARSTGLNGCRVCHPDEVLGIPAAS